MDRILTNDEAIIQISIFIICMIGFYAVRQILNKRPLLPSLKGYYGETPEPARDFLVMNSFLRLLKFGLIVQIIYVAIVHLFFEGNLSLPFMVISGLALLLIYLQQHFDHAASVFRTGQNGSQQNSKMAKMIILDAGTERLGFKWVGMLFLIAIAIWFFIHRPLIIQTENMMVFQTTELNLIPVLMFLITPIGLLYLIARSMLQDF